MKPFLLSAVVVLAAGWVQGQNDRKVLSLTLKPINERYCSGDSEVAFLRLRVQLRFKNETKDVKVSISRGDLHVDYTQIAKRLEDFSTKRYEANISSTSVAPSSVNLDLLDIGSFLVLPPGESGEAEITFDVPVSVRTQGKTSGVVQPGSYFVMIYVSGWLGSNELATRVEAALPAIGRLWLQSIPSFPLGLRVEATPVIEHCK